jgi:hypothetical protein
MSSSSIPPSSLFTLTTNKRFRNLYLSPTLIDDQTELTTQQDPTTTKTKTTTGEVEVDGETDDDDVPNKTKKKLY